MRKVDMIDTTVGKFYNILSREKPLTTAAMRLVEIRFGRPIRELIEEYLAEHHSLRKASDHFGVDFTTISKWKKRLGIRDYPDCWACPKESDRCKEECELLEDSSEFIKEAKRRDRTTDAS
mgnify:CR=1 FL=1